jgi:3-deoxy-D-manno-octulosonic acid (KDO) 8-phosphate synthase
MTQTMEKTVMVCDDTNREINIDKMQILKPWKHKYSAIQNNGLTRRSSRMRIR